MRSIACSLLVAGLLGSTAAAQDTAKPAGQAAQNGAVAPPAPAPAPAPVQSPEPTAPPKRVTVTFGLDFVSSYMFRGIYQEETGVIIPPFVDVGVALYQGTGTLSAVTANGGNWNSLHSGPSGNQGRGNAWYEADYYGSVTFTMGKWKPTALYTSYTSPNDAFASVHELAGVLAYDDSASRFPLAPKAIVAFELKGQADGGAHEGIYLELGVRPGVKLIDADKYPVTLAVPVKIGLSLHDYYEGPTGSNAFGYFDTGAIASVPLAFMPKGSTWEVHGGIDLMWLGENTKILNGNDGFKPIGSIGFSVAF
jgi:hypothetical protein